MAGLVPAIPRFISRARWDAAIWGAELAADNGQQPYLCRAAGRSDHGRPNLTDQKFPGNPTHSYCSRDPLRVLPK
jgi:rifampin ADP-ribosylating transferase